MTASGASDSRAGGSSSWKWTNQPATRRNCIEHGCANTSQTHTESVITFSTSMRDARDMAPSPPKANRPPRRDMSRRWGATQRGEVWGVIIWCLITRIQTQNAFAIFFVTITQYVLASICRFTWFTNLFSYPDDRIHHSDITDSLII